MQQTKTRYPIYLGNIIIVICMIFMVYNQTIPWVHAVSQGIDFNVKNSQADDSTYATEMIDISNANIDLTFRFIGVSDGQNEAYSISFPTGFVYQSYNNNGSTCGNFAVLNATNGNFHFSFGNG